MLLKTRPFSVRPVTSSTLAVWSVGQQTTRRRPSLAKRWWARTITAIPVESP